MTGVTFQFGGCRLDRAVFGLAQKTKLLVRLSTAEGNQIVREPTARPVA